MNNLFVPDVPAAPLAFELARVTSVTGGLYLRFETDGDAREKSYKRLGSYAPAVNDRVLVAKISDTKYVVLGKVV
jgi:hypothetical protein